MKILQHNVAGLKTRMVETLKRAHRLKVDVMAIQECNFSVKRLPGDKIDHEIPKMKGFNVEAAPRKRGRKTGTDSKSKGGVAWAIKEGINYQRIDKPPIAPNDDTTEWVGIRVFPEDGTEPLDLYNIYVPPIHDGDKDDDRVQNFDQDYLPSSFNTFIFADANCHGTWDARGKTSQMAKNWEEWTDNNSMSILNKDLSYTRKDPRGNESSPDITIAHQTQMGNIEWDVTYKDPSGSDHLPILTTITTSPPIPKRVTKKRRKKIPKWSFKKANWDMFSKALDQELGEEDNLNNVNVHQLSTKLIESFCTAGKLAIPKGNRPDAKPFWNDEIEDACKRRDEVRKEAQSEGT